MKDKIVKIDLWNYNHEWLLNGTSIGNALFINYKEIEDRVNSGDEYYQSMYKHILFLSSFADKELSKRKKISFDEKEELFGIYLTEYVTLDFDFAKELNLYDVVGMGCLATTKNAQIGNAIIEVANRAGFEFILRMRRFESKDIIELHFEVVHEDYVHECISALVAGKVSY